MNQLTLTELARELGTAETSASETLKTALLRDKGALLAIESIPELARFFAFSIVLANADNGKDTLRATRASGLSGQNLADAYAGDARDSLLLKLKLDAAGALTYDEQGLPALVSDGAKLSEILEAPYRALKSVNLAGYAASTALREALDGQATHPVKLSHANGSGGFTKKGSRATSTIPFCVSEEDFKTRESATLTCSAGYQKQWHVLLPWLHFGGNTCRLATLLALPDIQAQLTAEFESHGCVGLPALFAAMAEPQRLSFFSEPQVFAGDVPVLASDKAIERLSVLAPFAMFREISRAKQALKDEFASEAIASADMALAQLNELEDVLAKLKGSKPGSKAGKSEFDENFAIATKNVREAKLLEATLRKKYLHIEEAEVPHGGGNPRNMAMDLDKVLHRANVQSQVPCIRRAAIDIVAARTYASNTLLAEPPIHGPREAPGYLKAGATGSIAVHKRQNLFANLAIETLAHLLGMREALAAKIAELPTLALLSNRDYEHIENSEAAWQLFVFGDSSMKEADATARLLPLVRGVMEKINGALTNHYSKTPISQEYNAELLKVIAQVVAHERA